MVSSSIPTVDLSFYSAEAQVGNTDKARKSVCDACSEYGLFQIVNHEVPLTLMTRALQLSKTFFELPTEEKLKVSSPDMLPLSAGYKTPPNTSDEKFENFTIFSLESGFNVLPDDAPELRKVMEELFLGLTNTASLVESILNDCLGLPPNFLQEYNPDRRWDSLTTWKYFPATETGKSGLGEHQDGNCFTFVFADDQGLELLKDGAWVPVVPTEGSLIVVIGDILQVMSNNKFKSVIHRVAEPQEKSRHSYAFFHNIDGNKWIEPLPEFTTDIGQPAKYRGFLYKDYQQARIRNKAHPPSRPEDYIDITHYAITQ